MKKVRYALLLGVAWLLLANPNTVMHSLAANYNYVTITVDAIDDSGYLQYAIDSDDPEAFGDQRSFQVVPGSTHTIYVKDLAGNISSQVYTIPESDSGKETDTSVSVKTDASIQATTNVHESYDPESDEHNINIDVNLSNGSYSASGTHGNVAEDGGGTLFNKEKTDGSDESGKIFYTVTTKEGEVFYLIIDQNRNDNNVYLLTQTTVNDLQYLADQNNYNFTTSGGSGQSSQGLLHSLSTGMNSNVSSNTELVTDDKAAKSQSGMNSTLMLVIIFVIGGGGYYIYKTKKDSKERQMDEIDSANDLEDYEIDEDSESDVLDFEEASEEQDASLEDEELMELMSLDSDLVFGDSGDDHEADPTSETMVIKEPIFDDYDEFEEDGNE